MEWEEAQDECLDYVLIMRLPIIGEMGFTGLNADEVVECAHEYGITIEYERLPKQPGEIVASPDYEVQWPSSDGKWVGQVG
jgi:hypothetical protein